MWKIGFGSIAIILAIWVIILPSSSESFPDPWSYNNNNDYNTIIRELMKYRVHNKPITRNLIDLLNSGTVNLRSTRSEDNNNFLRLGQLQELDKMYGSKARPRFGKRSEMSLESSGDNSEYDENQPAIVSQ